MRYDDVQITQTKRKRAKPLPVWAAVVLDLLALAAALNVFALFHHVLPRELEPAVTSFTARPAPEPSAAPAPLAETPAPETAEDAPEPEEEITGLAKTFAEHFTDEVVVTETSYSSPNVSISIERRDIGDERIPNVCYIADIYVADVRCFRSWFAGGTYGHSITQDVMEMAEDSGALLAMTGDFYGYQQSGIVLRNGALYRDTESDADLCVLYDDGGMVTYSPGTLDLQAAVDGGAWQIWSFGPMLLDNEGNIPEEINNYRMINARNPRAAVGYYEPGHYCFAVFDGRQTGYSSGVQFEDMAALFHALGCRTAYNLDGGNSAQMVFDGARVNSPSSGGRHVSDILMIGEVDGE